MEAQQGVLMAIWRLLNRVLLEFTQIQKKLDRIIELLEPGPAVKLVFTSVLEGKITEGVTHMDLRDDQKTTLSISPVDAKGKPAAIDGAPTWASSDETVISLEVAGDGMTAVANGVAPGTARVVVTADADLGSGTTPITGTLDFNVTAGQAATITITAAPPASQ
jgi:hypothetical protein